MFSFFYSKARRSRSLKRAYDKAIQSGNYYKAHEYGWLYYASLHESDMITLEDAEKINKDLAELKANLIKKESKKPNPSKGRSGGLKWRPN